MRIARVLSIDAWADSEPDSWNWNEWWKVGEVDLDANVIDVEWSVKEGYVNRRALKECEVDDDGYNLTLMVKGTHKPLYAVEYGCVYDD